MGRKEGGKKAARRHGDTHRGDTAPGLVEVLSALHNVEKYKFHSFPDVSSKTKNHNQPIDWEYRELEFPSDGPPTLWSWYAKRVRRPHGENGHTFLSIRPRGGKRQGRITSSNQGRSFAPNRANRRHQQQNPVLSSPTLLSRLVVDLQQHAPFLQVFVGEQGPQTARGPLTTSCRPSPRRFCLSSSTVVPLLFLSFPPLPTCSIVGIIIQNRRPIVSLGPSMDTQEEPARPRDRTDQTRRSHCNITTRHLINNQSPVQ